MVSAARENWPRRCRHGVKIQMPSTDGWTAHRPAGSGAARGPPTRRRV